MQPSMSRDLDFCLPTPPLCPLAAATEANCIATYTEGKKGC